MDLQRIEQLLSKSSFTQADKNEIKEAADAAGMEYTIKQGCRACYEKLLLRLYEAKNAVAAVSLDGYRLKRQTAAFKTASGVVYSNSTLAGLTVENLHPAVKAHYFFKVQAETETENQEPANDGTVGEV